MNLTKALLVLACALALVAQQSKKQEKPVGFEYCGHGSSHECRCIRHTQAVQDDYLKRCQLNSKTPDELSKCMAHTPGHCALVAQYDASADYDPDNPDSGSDADMSERCTMACKKHDCRCDDGPTCHIGHTAADHAPKKQP